MTTPDKSAVQPGASPDPGAARAKRPEPPRAGPLRGGAPGGPAFNDGAGDRGAGGPNNLTEDVAQAVRVGYEVFANNLEIGRRAASEFSQGQYNFRRVPQDAGLAAHEVIRLLRELSESAFDICDRLAQQLADSTIPKPNPVDPAPVPPFRASPNVTAAPNPGPPALALAVRFAAPTVGRALVSSLTRPQAPTSPAEISVSPLLPRDRAAAPITDVAFEYDLASGGLTATVTAPDGQADGVYSGVVWASTHAAPLGVLAIELGK